MTRRAITIHFVISGKKHSNVGKSQEFKDCPKTGVRTYARTPVFGILPGNS